MSVRRNVVANLAASAWTGLIGLAMLPFYLHFVGIEAYGLIGFLVTLQAWCALLDMGLTPTLNREMARFSAGAHTAEEARDLLRSMEVVYGGVALAIALAIAALAGPIATGWLNLRSLDPAVATRSVALMGLVIAVQWLGTLYRSGLLGLQDQVWLNAAVSAVAGLRAVASVALLAYISRRMDLFFLLQCGVSLLETVVLRAHLHARLPRIPRRSRFNSGALRKIWRFAAALAGTAVLTTALTQVDKLLLAKLLPLDQYGYFMLAVAAAGVLSLLIGPIHNVAYPRLSELVAAGNQAMVAAEYHRFAQLLSVIVLPPALLLAVFSREIILLWTASPQTADAVAPVAAVWVVGTALNGVMHVPYAAQLAHGWSRLTMLVNFAAVCVLVPATLLFVPQYGAIAAAWIWVGTNVGYVTIDVFLMHRRILRHEKWRWYLHDIARPLLPGAAGVAALAVLHGHLAPWSRAGEFVFLCGAMAAIFLLVLLATPAGVSLLRSKLGPALPHFRIEDERA